MHPSESRTKPFGRRGAPPKGVAASEEPERKFYTLLKRGPGGGDQAKGASKAITWRKPPETEEPPPGLAGVWERLSAYFFCPMYGLERALLLIAVPLGLAIAVLLAVTAVGR